MDSADKLAIHDDDLIPYGRDKAKVKLRALRRERTRPGRGRLVLVSALTPTKAGEGKTTTSIGLADALTFTGRSACLALREPSIGPCMGVKGGGTGGGKSRLVPTQDINLHFTGDMHAVTSAHNLVAAALDNHLHFGNALGIDATRAFWRRVIDINDRTLRNVVTGLGGVKEGVPRETGFDITAASELMAILCLSDRTEDLRRRIDGTPVAVNWDREPVTIGQLGVTGAVLALLHNAQRPNLVKTAEGTPAFVHGGPFANIAHGCSSVAASRMALHHADWAVTEAGFGTDLGAEKFFNIKCAASGLDADAVVVVATVRALKLHGGMKFKELERPDPDAVHRGLPNLAKHVENMAHFGKPAVVAINRFTADTDDEIEVVRRHCEEMGAASAVSEHFAKGGAGAVELAERVVEAAQSDSVKPRQALYSPEDSIPDKLTAVAQKIYGADSVRLTLSAKRDVRAIEEAGWGRMPVCVAKTQSSLSDDPKLRCRPEGFDVTVRQLVPNPGAGFIVALTGEMVRMPGLPRSPAALKIDVVAGEIVGVG